MCLYISVSIWNTSGSSNPAHLLGIFFIFPLCFAIQPSTGLAADSLNVSKPPTGLELKGNYSLGAHQYCFLNTASVKNKTIGKRLNEWKTQPRITQ